MNKNRETEIKIKLTEDIYTKILNSLKTIKGPCTQYNAFYDTADYKMLKSRWALRLREENKIFYLTAKGPALKTGGYYDRPEIEEIITNEEIKNIRNGFYLEEIKTAPCIELKKKFGNLYVTELFSFKNTRTYLDYKGLILEADKTIIKDEIFYELEIETNRNNHNNANKKITKLFIENKWGLSYSKNGKMAKAVKIFLGDIT